jgi:hypothetical protein
LPDEPDAVNPVVGDQRRSHIAPTLHDRDRSGREPGVDHRGRERGGRERRLLGGLQDRRVAGRQGGGQQLGGDVHREVPRRDQRVDAVGLAEGEDPFVRIGAGQDLGFEADDLLGREPEDLSRLGDLVVGLGRQRLARFPGELLGQLVMAAVDEIGDLVE